MRNNRRRRKKKTLHTQLPIDVFNVQSAVFFFCTKCSLYSIFEIEAAAEQSASVTFICFHIQAYVLYAEWEKLMILAWFPITKKITIKWSSVLYIMIIKPNNRQEWSFLIRNWDIQFKWALIYRITFSSKLMATHPFALPAISS